MSKTYIIFEHLEVYDANCIAGFTYGFPAITHFLGFGHALSRKLSKSFQLELKGCAIICHHHQIHAYKRYGDYIFAQSKNSPTSEKYAKGGAPIIEEGKMNMTVSLVMECLKADGTSFDISRDQDIKNLKQYLMSLAYQHPLAGGSIQKIKSIKIETEKSDEKEKTRQIRKIKASLLPGFVLMDRSDLLENFNKDQNTDLIDYWLNFSAIKYKAIKEEDEIETKENKAKWQILPREEKGWLVPITNGYKAITKTYGAGEVKGVRNSNYPFCFVEAVHSVGEWLSLHRIKDLSDIIWQYNYEQDWYLCCQKQKINSSEDIILENDSDELDDFYSTL